jgi:predicted DNA-binding transcriptional regulator AlpA
MFNHDSVRYPPDNDEIWTTEEVAMYLKIPIATIYTWNKTKIPPDRPPFYKIGKHNRYLKKDVVDWFEANREVIETEWTKRAPLTLNAKQTAALMSWTLEQLDYGMKNGKCPPYRVSVGIPTWEKTEVEEWMEHNRIPPYIPD